MITGPGDPDLMEKLKGAESFVVMIFKKESFEEGTLVALQLEAERQKKPFIAAVWHELEIPEDTFLPNVIIIRCGHESVEKLHERIDKAVKEWIK